MALFWKTVLKINRKNGKSDWSVSDQEGGTVNQNVYRGFTFAPIVDIDFMEQTEETEKMHASPLHVCEWVRCVKSDDGLSSNHGGGGMVQRPMGGVL
jgi:hypothetical protein